MRVLVTGGMGFIGSNFVRLLLAERSGWEVWTLDYVRCAAMISSWVPAPAAV
jgi:nucleoside-diphosphate-sugar epimerase